MNIQKELYKHVYGLLGIIYMISYVVIRGVLRYEGTTNPIGYMVFTGMALVSVILSVFCFLEVGKVESSDKDE